MKLKTTEKQKQNKTTQNKTFKKVKITNNSS